MSLVAVHGCEPLHPADVALLLNKLGNLQDMPESFVIHDASLVDFGKPINPWEAAQ